MPRIIVTQSDIKNGVPGDSSDCAIARAAKRAFPRAQKVSVGTYAMLWTDKNGEDHELDWTSRETSFITRFDRNATERANLEPFEIEVVKVNSVSDDDRPYYKVAPGPLV